MKMLTITTLLITTLVFADGKIKANAGAKVHVKGKNSFKFHQAMEGMSKASKMFTKAKTQYEQSVKAQQQAQVKFQAIGQAIQKTRNEEKQRMLQAQRVKVEKQVKSAQQIQTQSKTQMKTATSMMAYSKHMEGEYYYDNKKYKKAFQRFEASKSIASHKEIHKTHYFMGKVYEKKKKKKKKISR
eukprot:NODE_2157_length_639_cov_72.136719_g2107_i0.p1 GENE.NODE_2157_length_639_cov_72.136719_g2107_i0~~NODE_2157_length_639_cov_72.136719_g2107_i0.p1  ORF type:complete len:185 (-),score=26.00 NODE_2157_length_639_cov_72.136719_g2107_i0:16-570(-)